MKKILMICAAGVLASLSAHATTMCAADDTLSIVLDPSIAGTANSYRAELSEWQTTFPYGTVFGISTCVSTPSGTSVDTLIDNDTGNIAKGAERLGVNCWCKMMHPVNSRWVFRGPSNTVVACGADCAFNCAIGLQANSHYRGLVFGSVVD